MTTRNSFSAVTSGLRASGTDPVSEGPTWRDLLLQGGRVTKYKGIACGMAPHGTAGASVGLSVAAAAVFSLGGMLLSSTAVLAGACGPGPNVVCSGPADAGTDTPQTFTGSDISIVTDPGFGLDVASGNAITSTTGTDGFSFEDTNSSSITGSLYGMEIVNSTSGDIVIRSNGHITGTGWDAIQATNNAGTGGITIDVNDLDGGRRGVEAVNNGNGAIDIKVSGTINSGWAGIYAYGGAASTGLKIDANNIESDSQGIDIDYSGTGDVSVTANNIVADNVGILVNTGFDTENFTIDVNSIETGAGINVDGIQGVVRGTGDVNITVHDSIVATDDGMQLEFFNVDAGKINISVNDVTGGNAAGNYGLWIINWANPAADQANSLNIIANGHIQAYEAGILTDTNTGMLTNITIKAGAVVEAASGLAIWDEDGDTHIVVEDASEAAGSVKGRIELFTGKEVVDLHGGFSGITRFVTDGQDGDTLNVFDANSSFDADNLGKWDTINLDNTMLKLDTGTDSEVGAAADMSNGFFLKNNSVLDVSANNDFDNVGNMSIDATSAFLARADGTDGDVWITGGLRNDGLVSLSKEDGTGLAGDGLRVSGAYTGNNGTVILDTVLGDDTSATDTMTFAGGTAGHTNVIVNNVGGAGAQTVEGIKIINVSGASDGTFALIGDYEIAGQQAVIGGAYGYTLWKNGVSTPTDGDWYLRSQLDPNDPSGSVYQPGAPVLEAYPQILLGLNGLPTLQQRVGNRLWSGNGAGVVSQGADAIDEQAPVGASPVIEGSGIWGRIEGAYANIDPNVSTTGSEYDFNTQKFQAGLDIPVLENGSGALLGGVTAHYGHASADMSSPFGDGSISTDGYGVGATLTWYGSNGFYLDGQGQVSWYDSDLDSDVLGELASGNNGSGYALSLETGKRIELNDLTLTPQAQLVYSSVDFDSFTQKIDGRDIADVSLREGDSLRGRLGLSLDREASWQADNGLLSRSHVYSLANLHYEFLDGTAVDVSGVELANRADRLWGGIGLGGSYNWNDDKYSLYGEASVNTSLENFADSYDLKGTAGLRVSW